MPTNIHIASSSQNLSQIARQHFKVTGSQSAALEKQVVEAIRQANPHLKAGADRIAPGAIIAIPDVEGIARQRPERKIPEEAAKPSTSTEEVQKALKAVESVMKESFKTRQEQLQAAQNELKQHKKELTSIGEDVAARVADLEAFHKKRAAELKEAEKLYPTRFKRLEEAFDVIDKLLQQRGNLR